MKQELEAEVWEVFTEKGSVYMQTAAVERLQEGHCSSGVWMVEEVFCV